jgi:hypothetical protein
MCRAAFEGDSTCTSDVITTPAPCVRVRSINVLETGAKNDLPFEKNKTAKSGASSFLHLAVNRRSGILSSGVVVKKNAEGIQSSPATIRWTSLIKDTLTGATGWA